jgi:hypothetical protein
MTARIMTTLHWLTSWLILNELVVLAALLRCSRDGGPARGERGDH